MSGEDSQKTSEGEIVAEVATALAENRNSIEGFIPDHSNAYKPFQFNEEAQVAWNTIKRIALNAKSADPGQASPDAPHSE